MDEMNFAANWQTIAVISVVLLVILIAYYVFVIRALVNMIRVSAPSVMLVFTYISLIPLPFFLVLGVVNLIVWHQVQSDLLQA